MARKTSYTITLVINLKALELNLEGRFLCLKGGEKMDEKRIWLKEAGIKEFKQSMKYYSRDGYLYSEEYIRGTPIEKLKASYRDSVNYGGKFKFKKDNINSRNRLSVGKSEEVVVDIDIKIEGLEEFLAEFEDGIDEINSHIENKLKDLAERKISIIAEVNGGD